MTDHFRVSITIPKSLGVETHWEDDGSVKLVLSSSDPDDLARIGPESHRFGKEVDIMTIVAMWGRTMVYVCCEDCPPEVEKSGRKLCERFENMIRRSILLLDPLTEAHYATGGMLAPGAKDRIAEVERLDPLTGQIDAAEEQGKFQKLMAEAIAKGWKVKAPPRGSETTQWIFKTMLKMNQMAYEAGSGYSTGLDTLMKGMADGILSDPKMIAKLREDA